MANASGAPGDPLIIACPADGALNRVPAGRIGAHPICGTCRQPLFQGAPVTLTAANFDRHASGSDIPLLIDFWAGWCGPCRQMAPQFQTAAGRLEPRIRSGKLDTEAEQAIAARYAIRSIPTLLIVHKGREIARTAGAMPAQAIISWAEDQLRSIEA